MKFIMRTTDDYDRLEKFFVENDLEFNDDEGYETKVIKCWKISEASEEDLRHIKEDNADGQDFLIAACVLATRDNCFVIDGIAVDKPLRKFGLGKMLVKKAVEEVDRLGGDTIYLVARAPEFFRKLGFETMDPEVAPKFFGCRACPQYGKMCFPEVMKMELKK